MTIVLKAVRMQGALHGLRESRDADHLIVHSDRSLFAIVWAALQNTPEGVAITLGPKGPGKLVAEDVAVDDAWLIEPKGQRVLIPREGEFESIDPWGQTEPQKTKVAGLSLGTFAAAIDAGGQHVLLVVDRDINPDESTYAIALADMANGRLILEKTIHSGSDLELLWDATSATWVIGDTSRGAVWRWDGVKPAIKVAAPSSHIRAATFAATTEGVIVSALADRPTGEAVLMTGHADRDRIAWTEPVPLAGPPVLQARRHPAQAVWACLTQQGAIQGIQIRDAGGKVLAEAALRPGAHLDKLLWSVSAPTRLWGFGTRVLAAATLSA